VTRPGRLVRLSSGGAAPVGCPTRGARIERVNGSSSRSTRGSGTSARASATRWAGLRSARRGPRRNRGVLRPCSDAARAKPRPRRRASGRRTPRARNPNATFSNALRCGEHAWSWNTRIRSGRRSTGVTRHAKPVVEHLPFDRYVSAVERQQPGETRQQRRPSASFPARAARPVPSPGWGHREPDVEGERAKPIPMRASMVTPGTTGRCSDRARRSIPPAELAQRDRPPDVGLELDEISRMVASFALDVAGEEGRRPGPPPPPPNSAQLPRPQNRTRERGPRHQRRRASTEHEHRRNVVKPRAPSVAASPSSCTCERADSRPPPPSPLPPDQITKNGHRDERLGEDRAPLCRERRRTAAEPVVEVLPTSRVAPETRRSEPTAADHRRQHHRQEDEGADEAAPRQLGAAQHPTRSCRPSTNAAAVAPIEPDEPTVEVRPARPGRSGPPHELRPRRAFGKQPHTGTAKNTTATAARIAKTATAARDHVRRSRRRNPNFRSVSAPPSTG